MKSLDQVEARTIVNANNTPGDGTNTFIIRTPGSYYLTGNITGASGKHGISVQADDVTLDLNGFALVSGGGGAFQGVDVPAVQKNLCIRNGTIRGWTNGGVRTDLATNTLAEKLRLSDNVGATGLMLGNGSAKDCVATGNATGFVLGNGAEIKDCAATANIIGFSTGDRAMITGCIASINSGVGFNCTSYVTLIDCTSSRNSDSGIVVQASCNIVRCSASRNLGNGIAGGPGCEVADCVVGNNGVNGIEVDNGGTVRNCTVQTSYNYGIAVNSSSQVIGNTCGQNSQGSPSGGGIIVFGNGNRIEANSCTSSVGFGIQVYPGANNLIIRNSAHANGNNFAFSAGNRYGTVVDLTANNPATVSGNSAAGTLTTLDPWANFAY